MESKLQIRRLIATGPILFLCVIIFAQDFSRQYIDRPANEGGDILHNEANVPSDALFKTTFKKQTLQDLLGQITNGYIKIRVVDPIIGKPRYRMDLYTSGGTFVQGKNGDYPCPNDCQPPDSMGIVGPNNTFDVTDLIMVMQQDNVTHVNVHSSSRFEDNFLLGTHTIYGLTGEYPNLQLLSTWEKAFTSIVTK